MKEVLREQIEAFTVFRAEDLLNVGFTPETERKTALANLERKLGLLPSPIKPLVDKEFMELEREVSILRADINMLNLINGLHLSSEQVEQLTRLARAAGSYQVERPTEIDIEAFKGLVRSLETMKRLLLNGRDIPLPMLAHALKLAQRANLLSNPAPQPTGLREVAQQVLSILTEEQKQVLADYKPCLIPPKNLKDPVRVGQAPSNSGYIKALERIRQIPSAVYARRK